MTESGVLDLIHRWADAEQRNDAEGLDRLLAGDFVGVGPFGFVLNREQWLGRFAHGLQNHAVTVEEPQVHDHDGAAVVFWVLNQRTTAQGRDNSGRFRVTVVAAGPAENPRVAAVHIGPLHDPRSGPPDLPQLR